MFTGQEHGMNKIMECLCRDCATLRMPAVSNCPECGGTRTILHAELSQLHIAHLDCDAFFAAIEKRDNPELKDKPVIVGGAGRRGVVSTCCYVARLYGVRSAMPMFRALKLCPDAVVIGSNFAQYREASAIIRQKMLALTPLIQVVSIDEAYLDLSGTNHIHAASPAQSLIRLAAEIERDVGITVSIGLSFSKFLAKTASEMDKPRGFAVIGRKEARQILAPMPVERLHGVGPKLAARLRRDGYLSAGDLQDINLKEFAARYGETGVWLHQRANGIDSRSVNTSSERKSVSSEITFEEDISALTALEDRLWYVCEKTAQRAKSAGVTGWTVNLKLKTGAFQTLTRQTRLNMPTQLAQTLFRTVRPFLIREAQSSRGFRLIGVGLSELELAGDDARDLIDPLIEKRAAAERASDAARARFGPEAVVTGRSAKYKQSRAKK